MITIKNSNPSFKNTRKLFRRFLDRKEFKNLETYAQKGLDALIEATPKDSGETALSWNYRIVDNGETLAINYYNTKMNDGVPIAIILQYGHATKNGAWVNGVDYINPAIRPVFEDLKDDVWKLTKKDP